MVKGLSNSGLGQQLSNLWTGLEHHMRLKMNLASKLSILIVLAMALPLCIVAYVAYENSAQALRATTEQLSTYLVSETRKKAMYYTLKIEESIIFGSRLTIVKDYMDIAASGLDEETSKWDLYTAMNNVGRAVALASNICLVTGDGNIYRFPASIPLTQQEEYVNYYQQSEWFKKAIEDDVNAHWSKPYKSLDRDETVISCAAGVSSGGKRGVLFMEMNLNLLTTVTIGRISLGTEGFIMAMHSDGEVLFSNYQEMIGMKFFSDEIIQKMKSVNSGVIPLKINGDSILLIFDTADNIPWKVIGYIPEKEFFSESEKLGRFIFYFSLISIILGAFIALFFSFRITNPIKQLSKGLDEVASGDLSKELEVKSKDEIGELTVKFNHMSAALKTARESVVKNTLQLEEKNNELEAKNAELERFTYTVSHDLKSPLITIKGFSGFIRDSIQKERYDRVEADLVRVQNAADKMSELLQGLLDLSRIGRMVNPSETFSTTALVKDVVELLDGGIHSKGICVKIQENMPWVQADKYRIREVFQNLIENAVKFMDKKEGVIEIGCIQLHGIHTFYIKDNGQGIDPRYHEKIFGLFEKLDAGQEGSGIGLALVKRIVEFHGGKIWLESTPMEGSTFYFTLGGKVNNSL